MSPFSRKKVYGGEIGPKDKELKQATYPMQHVKVGVAHIFIVPVGFEHDQFLYEAVFACRKADAPEQT